MAETPAKKRVTREFFLSTGAVNNRTTVMVLMFIIILFGLVAYITMPKAAFPDLVIPQIYVGTPYPGNSPVDIEKLLTRPMEKEINTISEVDKISSTSIQGYSTILVEFDFSVEPSEALQKVKDAVDKAKSDPSFPDDLPTEPNIFEMNFSEFPILNVNLSGDFSADRLREYAEYLEDKIENIPEISKVDIRGVQEKEVKIMVDLPRMESLDISFNDVVGAIQSENVTVSGGDLLTDGVRRTVRVAGDFTNMEEIENVIVKREKQEIVYLKDIADVKFDFEERTSYAREFQKPVVMLDIVKKSGENLIAACEKIQVIIDEAQANHLPDNLELTITNDQSDMTMDQVNNLENSIISGVILVVLVLLFFLGLRNALFVGIAIPLSMFTAFMILGGMGTTINMMVLFALILALGMLVDNGIVVVENIYRLMDEGMPARQAAKEGAGEVAWAIIASTATTLAAFLPLAFWPGMMGEFMQYLPITLIIVLGSSLFVGLVINPVLTAKYMRTGDEKPKKKKSFKTAAILVGISLLFYLLQVFTMANLLVALGFVILINAYLLSPAAEKFQQRVMPKLESRYERFLGFALSGKKPRVFFLGTIGMLFFSFVMLGVFTPKIEFFPINMPKYLNVFIEMPIGTDIEETNKITKEVEEIVAKSLKRYEVEEDGKKFNYLVESVIAQVGEGTSDPARGPVMGNTPHKARVQVSFVKFNQRRGVSTADVMRDVRKAVRNKIPGAKITVGKDEAGPPQGLPINIEVIGDDYEQLLEVADNMRKFINSKNIAGIEELQLDVDLAKPELLVNLDRAKLRRLNMSTSQVGQSIRTALFGFEASKFKDKEDDFPIQVRFADKYRYDQEALMNQRITFRDQTNGQIRQIPISAIADPIKKSTFSSVKRKDLNRVITVGSNILEGYNPTETVNNIKEALNDYEVPEGVSYKFTGQQEEQAKEMAFLSKALMIAVFLIFLIIVAQFNSSATPFIIVGSVVFSLIGVLMGLVIFQMDFIVIMTMVGIISLAGVVVNNAIVLIDYTNLVMQRRKQELGMSEDDMLPMDEIQYSIIQGGKLRLRPVLLTAITTILGLLPLAIGFNINFFTLFSEFDPQIFIGGDNVIFWGPMSWTVIFGLSFATFLTLVIVPVMYYMVNKLKLRVKKVKPAVA